MRIRALRDVIRETTARTALDAPHPNLKGLTAGTEESQAAAAVEALKQRADATFPGQFEPPSVLAARELHRIEAFPETRAMERTIGSEDLVDLNYLLRGLDAARSVARIAIRGDGGHNLGDATGFLVSPSLLLTNWHVFQDGADVASCWAEFDYELDLGGAPRATTRFELRPDLFYLEDRALDFALVAVGTAPTTGAGRREDYLWLRLNPATAKILDGEPVTIIQHPEGRPKQIALRENRLLGRTDAFLTYEADTAPGSSGAPVFNNSWQVVALHHSGVPRTDAAGRWLLRTGQPATEDSQDDEIDWVANEGVRVSSLVEHVLAKGPAGALRDEFEAYCMGRKTAASVAGAEAARPATAPILATPVQAPVQAPAQALAAGGGSAVFTVPLTISVTLGGGATVSAGPGVAAGAGAVERTVEPWHDTNYAGRKGYRPDFLGATVALPRLRDPAVAARMTAGGATLVPYANFSLVMHRERRLPIFTAANVDFSRAAKEPEPGRSYNRAELGGLGENDKERWFLDPRLPADCQLPDRFFDNDRQAFDKGHLVRREEVCWGATYDEVRRANGDTYHVTNCTPQVAGFNRSLSRGVWGLLENVIEKQGRTEKYCLLAGPVLADDDPIFVGVDDQGPIQARIPRAFWKVLVARTDGKLQAFGFLLEQDLSQVRFEFRPTQAWKERMVRLKDIETRARLIRFAAALTRADQFGAPATP